MNFLFVTVGTGGDVFPHIELGAELISRGRGCTLCTDLTCESAASGSP